MDPYVKLQMGSQTFKTKTHKNAGKKPSWFDVCEFIRTDEEVLNVQVYDEDIISDDLVGSGVLELKDICIPGRQMYSDSIILKYKNKKAGELYLEVNFYADQDQLQTEFNKSAKVEAVKENEVESKKVEDTKADTKAEPTVPEPKKVEVEMKVEEKEKEKEKEKAKEKVEAKAISKPRLGPPCTLFIVTNRLWILTLIHLLLESLCYAV
jgi:thiol:disulfide interchange protein